MKKKQTSDSSESKLMLKEYDFDYTKAKQNRFAKDYEKSAIRIYDGTTIISEKKPILIDIDLLKFFRSPNQVNLALRSLMQAKKRIFS